MQATGMIVYFDATASGPQILGLSTNCKSSMELTNVIPTRDSDGNVRRRDLYLDITDKMYEKIDKTETVLKDDPIARRKQVKKPIMTTFYGSKKQPEQLFGKHTPDHFAFMDVMADNLPGPMMLMEEMQACWDETALYHEWVMPNGAHVKVAVLDKLSGDVKTTINGKEVKLPFNVTINRPVRGGLSLAANITHSVDNYVKDLVVEKFKMHRKPITVIHDCFGVHPNDVPLLMNAYRAALVRIYDDRVIEFIIRQLKGDDEWEMPQIDSESFAYDILQSEYALS